MAFVLGPEDGESHWQPLPSCGYVINKINPYTSFYDDFPVFIQILVPGAHTAATRTSVVTNWTEIAAETFDVQEGAILLIGRGCRTKSPARDPVDAAALAAHPALLAGIFSGGSN